MKKIPAHQWTNENGEVLILRFSDKNGKSYNGFQHPMTVGESVVEPKWNEAAVCGGGIHGWPWGIGLGEGKECEWESLWQVYGAKPEEVVGEIEGGQKCKFKTGTLRFLGKWDEAMKFILSGQIKWVEQWAGEKHATGDRSASSATGYRSASSATGYRSASSATGNSSASSATGDSSASSATGDSSASSATGYSSASSATGDRSASSATGYRSASSATGDRSASSATGYSSASSATGKASAAIVTGDNGRAKAGEYGCVALAWWNAKYQRYEMRCALTGAGPDSLKADVWYRLNAKGEFIEAE